LVAISEVALAVVLLTGGGLLLRSFARLLDTPLGFDPRGTLVARTMFDGARYPEQARRSAVQRELLERLRHLPGITSVAAASHLPLSDERQIGVRMEHAAKDEFHWAANSLVSPGYFQAMGIQLLRGRDFNEDDRPDSVPVAIVSEAFARQYFPGQEAIGQRFQWGDRALFTIVGIASDVHIAALDADPPPMVYNSMFQVESGAVGRTAFVLRGGERQDLPASAIQQVLASADEGLPLYGVTRMSALLDESVSQRRFTLQLLGGFAGCAVFLAMTGLYGVLSYLVQQREREIGVRMALGADRAAILTMIVRRGLLLGGTGCLAGLLLSALSAPLLRASLYHVSRFDPLTLGLVLSLLMGVTLISVLIPARRAVSIDPMQALRSE
jgi:predicted permease